MARDTSRLANECRLGFPRHDILRPKQRCENEEGTMQVLVTGGAGYIGSVIVEELLAAGHSVVVYDSLVKGHLDAVHPEATFVHAQLAERDHLRHTLEESQIEAVIHMAAFSLVPESVTYPE